MKTSLNLKTGQQLALTPQLQQAIRLLQISTTELHEELEEAASNNPLLEVEELQENPSSNGPTPNENSDKSNADKSENKNDEGSSVNVDENFDYKEINHAEEWAQVKVRKNNISDDGGDQRNNLNEDPITLSRHLQSQLGTMNLSKKERTWVEILIQALDSDGYLRESVEELELPFSKEFEEEFGERLSEEELHIGVKLLQSLDPKGIGARDLSECLILQLTNDNNKSPEIEAAKLILSDHLELLAQHNISGLVKASGLTRELIHAADIKIKQLNPKPASVFKKDVPITVIPDVVVYKNSDGIWSARLNTAALPKVRIHENYAKAIQDSGGLKGPLNQQLIEARWMLKNVQQRFDTILRVTQTIVEVQQDFGKPRGSMKSLYSASNYQCSFKKGNDCRTSLQELKGEKKGSPFFKACAIGCKYKEKKSISSQESRRISKKSSKRVMTWDKCDKYWSSAVEAAIFR